MSVAEKEALRLRCAYPQLWISGSVRAPGHRIQSPRHFPETAHNL